MGTKRVISRPRKTIYIVFTLLMVCAVQEALCRIVFPLPEVSGFNRNRYTLKGDLPESVTVADVANFWALEENEVEGIEFWQRHNLYGFRGQDFQLRKAQGRQ